MNPNWSESQIAKWTLKNDKPLNSKCATSLVDAYLYAKTAFPAAYEVFPSMHISMGLDCYSKVTSPIRRYVDQLVHQQIKTWIIREVSQNHNAVQRASKLMLDWKELKAILPYLNDRELRTKWLQRNSAKFWVLQYMKHIQSGLVKEPRVTLTNKSESGKFILSGTIVYYNELLRLYYIFLDFWNIPIIHREDILQLDIGMKVDMEVTENEPLKSIFRVQIIKRYFN